MATVSFDVSTADRATIRKISTRAIKLIKGLNLGSKLPSRSDIAMDITATHANGLPLRLSDMLGADNFNFLHDIVGISKHLDRETGKLTGHFRPRFAALSDALIAEAPGDEVMGADKSTAFDDAFEEAARDEYESVSIDRAKHTRAYLEDLVSEDEEIASFTVAEIIEHLNRRL